MRPTLGRQDGNGAVASSHGNTPPDQPPGAVVEGQTRQGDQVMPATLTRRTAAQHRKFIALAAAAGVVLSGATVTSLAAWLDEEWVTAGVDGDPGVTASEFEIEQ